MSIFKNKTWKWWQVSVLKICCAAYGLAAGAYFAPYILPFLWPILIVAIVLTIYLAFFWFEK